MKLNNLILVLTVFFEVFFVCPPAQSGVRDDWDWNDGKRTLKVWINVPAGTKIGGVDVSDAVRAAMNKINTSNSGWKLGTGTAADHDIEVKLEDMDEDVGGACNEFTNMDKDRKVSKRTLKIDPDPKGGETWGTEGNSFDPVTVMLHELLHKCRIKHQSINGDSVGTTGNAADPSLTGERKRSLSKDDVDDLKDSNSAPIRKVIQQAGPSSPGSKNLSIDSTSVTFPDWTFYTDVEIGLSLTSDQETVVNPFNIPDYNNYRIIRGVLLDITGAYTYSAQGLVSFRLAYLDSDLDDPEFLPVDEQSLMIFIYNASLGYWYRNFTGVSHDDVNNFLDFSLDVDYLLSFDNFGFDPCNPSTCFTFVSIGGLETPRLKAANPTPLNGSTQIEISPTLSWTPGHLAQPTLGHAVYLGTDYDEVFNATTATPGIFRSRQTSCSYALSGLHAETMYYWRVDEYNDVEIQSPWKGRIWRFTTIGGACANPVPVSGTIGLPVSVQLNWTPGAFAVTHHLFLGTDSMEVTDASTGNPLGIYIGAVSRPYTLGNLPFDLARDTNYYWRIDEANAVDIWKGETWMFRNTDFLVVDDFDSYINSDDMNQKWVTNYDLSPVCFFIYAHAGLQLDQTMLSFSYSNVGSDYFSEARFLANNGSAADWTGGGALPSTDPIVSLAVSYLGNASNTADPTYDRMYIALEDNYGYFNIVLNPDPNAARNFYQWNQWNIALADLGVPSPVTLSSIKYLYLGFGERCNMYIPGGTGTVLFDDLRLYQRRCVPECNSPPGDFTDDCKVNLHDLYYLVNDWLITGTTISLPIASPSVAPKVWYKFDETGGIVVTNFIGDGNDGEIINPSLDSILWDIDGGFDGGGGLNLMMSSQTYVEVPITTLGFLETQKAMTMMLWLNMDYYSLPEQNPHLLSIWEPNSGEIAEEVALIECPTSRPPADDEGPKVRMRWAAVDTGVCDDNSSPLMRLENFASGWNHYAFVKDADANSMKVYHNGLLIMEADATIAPLPTPPLSAFRIGAAENSPDADFWVGRIDDFRLYDHALSAQEIAYIGTRGTGVYYIPIDSPANLYTSDVTQRINFRDFAIMAQNWLEQTTWP